MAVNPQHQFVFKTIENRDVHFVRLWFADVLGSMKSFAITASELEDAFEEGVGFDGSFIEGFNRSIDPDMLAIPDATTFQVLPWRPQTDAVARMFCDICTPDGKPFEGDPRRVLMRQVERAQDMGYVFNVGPELEFYYFKDPYGTEVLDHGGFFDLTSLDTASDLRRDTILTLEKMGIPVEFSHHENGPSQHEIDLRYTDAVTMADAVMTYKMVVKEIAFKHGVYASFMPKPMSNQPGSGMHVHQSLSDFEGNSVFYDPEDPMGYNLSKIAKHYIAGLLKYAPEFTLLTNQNINSYKRMVAGGEAPTYLSWAKRNRSTLIRVPGYRDDDPTSCRIELRSPDPAANPYLAFAAMLAAGLKGIEDELELQPPTETHDLFNLSRQELREMGIRPLPDCLGEAVELFAKSDFMREVLGDHIHSYLVKHKRDEWNEYQGSVTQWEIDRYLAVL